jgi:hypothetical protein
MVCTPTGDFVLDVLEGSSARRGAVPTGPHRCVSTTTTSTTHEHRVDASHTERAHAGADGEPRAPRRPLATPPTGVGLLLH